MTAFSDWAQGDALGIPIPAHAGALREGGADFLTRAFRAAGSLGGHARVAEMRNVRECEGGSTGRKLRLEVTYRGAPPGLPENLFVKFSRDRDDPIRDRARVQMESEVRIALMSRLTSFPVPVPRCMFADFEGASGTGILVTEAITFGENGIEPHREKCLDADLGDPLGHYRALLSANARLAGAQRAGRFPAAVLAPFADGSGTLAVSDRRPYSADQLMRRIDRLREFARDYPRLLPEAVRAPSFLDRFAREAPRFCGHEEAIATHLERNDRYRALSHWNANIDNGWFWRDAAGTLQCGLLDWGNSRVMNIGVALGGSLMAAEADFLVASLDTLVSCYIEAFIAECGETLDPAELKDQMFLHNACSGLLWLIDAPAMIMRNCEDLASATSRFDPRIRGDELVRNQLHMLTVFLSLWQGFDYGSVLDRHVAALA